jgi:uncharacterized protein (DUF1778 family)
MTAPKKRKRGRPKGARNRVPGPPPRGTLTLRLDAGERDELERAADEEGEPLATWARETLLAMAREGAEARERLRATRARVLTQR